MTINSTLRIWKGMIRATGILEKTTQNMSE